VRLKHRAFTPLDDVDLLDSRSREVLHKHHVTTVEEFLGQLEAVPDQIGELLGLDKSQLRSLREYAEELVGPEFRRALADQAGREYPLGALRPDDAPDEPGTP
jgi:hypothetical protein